VTRSCGSLTQGLYAGMHVAAAFGLHLLARRVRESVAQAKQGARRPVILPARVLPSHQGSAYGGPYHESSACTMLEGG
jgi:hypothetical protein